MQDRLFPFKRDDGRYSVAWEVKWVIVAHKDRLARFGFELIQHIAETHGCKIEVVNQETLSP